MRRAVARKFEVASFAPGRPWLDRALVPGNALTTPNAIGRFSIVAVRYGLEVLVIGGKA